ncbi:MAG: CoA transferase [Pseudonocardiaceae bacterium]
MNTRAIPVGLRSASSGLSGRRLPEQGVPERILRGQLAGAGERANVARDGNRLVLTGAQLPGGALECLLDWRGPDVTTLDEPLAQAACGLMAVHGRARGGRAARLGVDYVTTAAGLVLAQGVLAGLLARRRGATVDGVTVSVAGTALLTVSQYLAADTADEPDLMARSGPGHPPPFRSSDGVAFELETLDAEPWRRLWTGLGVSGAVAGRAWRPFMLRYATALAPLPAELHTAVAARSFVDLIRAATAAGVAVQPLRTHAERCRELSLELQGGDRFAAPWAVEPVGSPVKAGAQPEPGDGPLAGLVVVEAGRRVQGPLAGHVLGLLGANVVRIEPPGGDPLRGMPPMAGDCSARFLALNRGKRLVAADLRDPKGRAAVLDAVRDADAFLHNWAPGKAAELGLDHNDLHAVNPRLVSAHASGWGDALGTNPPPGTDFMVQAYAGLADHLTPAGQPPAGSLMTLLDVLGGLVTASAVLAGLLGRERDGQGRRVRSSLLSAATLLQAQLDERGPTGRVDWGVLGVPLPAADGHLVLSRTAEPTQVSAALGVGDLSEVPAVIAARPITEALERLTPVGMNAVRACPDLADLAADPWTATLLHHDRCTLVRPPWTFTTR